LRAAPDGTCGQLGGKIRGQLEDEIQEKEKLRGVWEKVRTWFVHHWSEYVPVDDVDFDLFPDE
jgi:hypothetical protein